MSEIGEYYEFAIDLAIKSGIYLSEGYKTKLDWKDTSLNTKVDQSDLVTEFDKKIEDFIFTQIREKYPSHKTIGEESSSEGKKWKLTDDPTWIVDPIDGTTNFVHGFPYTCVSIAVAVNQEVVVGVVHNPILNELFTAQKGKGAYLNGTKRLPLSYPNIQPLPSINEALFLAEYGGQRNIADLLPKVNSMHRLTLSKDDGGAHCRGIRALGACAMNMTLIAKGGADMFWEVGPHIWDYAAALLILREAGGVVVSHGGTYGKEDQDLKLEDYRTFDLCARKVACVRATNKVLLNRDLNDPEEVKRAEEHSFSLIREALKYIEDVPIERDGE